MVTRKSWLPLRYPVSLMIFEASRARSQQLKRYDLTHTWECAKSNGNTEAADYAHERRYMRVL